MDERSEEPKLMNGVESLKWYHTIELDQGVETPGLYDHRKYLNNYGLPTDLSGKTALDIGAASGYFSFEMEKRGASVTATELPTWAEHDFGPLYESDMGVEQAGRYLHDPFLYARKALGSHVQRNLISIYNISPETMGLFDLVFCGSVLVHLTDPTKALWQIQSVTREAAIIVTPIYPPKQDEPLALFVGHERGDGWWLPNQSALEAMIKSAGFKGWKWFTEFRLDFANDEEGPYHGVIHAWNTSKKPEILKVTDKPKPLSLLEKASLHRFFQRVKSYYRRKVG